MARRLLLADDSITIQKVVELVLAEEDFEIKSVSNGADALNLIEAFNPDIVLADIEMPKLNGYQLCEKIKTNPRTAAVPVILLAGAFEPVDNDLSRTVRADDVVIKPFESQELISKINAVLTMGAAEDMEAEAFAEPMDEALELGEEIETAIQPEPAELAAEEDLWAMEDVTETPGALAAEELSDEEFIAEAVEEAELEEAPAEITAPPAEFPREEPAVAAFVAQTAEAVSPAIAPAPSREPAPTFAAEGIAHDISLPSKDEIMALIDRKVGEQVAALFSSLNQTISQKIDQRLDQKLDLKDTLLAAATPIMKDSIEKILWEMAPELIEKVAKETVKGAFSSITAEVEKVLWETVPELAGTMISKEIEKIKASS